MKRSTRKKNVEVIWSTKDRCWYAVYDKDRFPYTTKSPAVRQGRHLARAAKTELLIKNKDGRIAYRNSYGGDSPKRPG